MNSMPTIARLLLLVAGGMFSGWWFNEYPLRKSLTIYVGFSVGRMALLLTAWVLVARLRFHLLEVGLALLTTAEFISLLGRLTTGHQNIAVPLDNYIQVGGIIIVIFGCALAWRAWRDKLDRASSAEAALRQSEERFRRMAETTCVIPWEGTDIERTRISYIGPQAVELLGFPKAMWHEPKFWLSRLHPDDRDAAIKLNQDLAADRQEFDLEYRLISADGRPIWFRDYVTVAVQEKGGTTLRGFMIDVTERSQAAIALQSTVSLLRATLDSTADGILVVDMAGKIVSFNERFTGLWRIPEGVLAARDDERALTYVLSQLKDPEAFLAKVRELYAKPAAESFDVLEFTDGRAFERHSRPQLIQGKPVGRVWSFHDISERRRDADKLQRERNLLRTFVDGQPDCIYIKDRTGRVLLTNEANCRLLDFKSADEFVGKTVFDFFPPEQAKLFAADDDLVVRTGKPVLNREEPFTRPDGRTGWFLTTKLPLRDTAGEITGLIGISRDITEQKNLTEERARLDRKMQEAQKLESLGVLAGGIAHDFNNLLTGMLGHASLGKSQTTEPERAKHYFAEIESSALRAADLCKQMLAYSGRGKFVVQKLDLTQLVQDTTQLLQHSVSKKATLNFRLAPNLPPVLADATQLRQILMNLVINASEALGDQSGVFSLNTGQMYADKSCFASAHLSPELAEGNYVFLEVTDTGSGIAPEVQARIFDPFFTTKFTGRGLGLAAVLGIVRGHNGALKVHSEPGKGSTFRLLLPAAAGQPEKPHRPEPPSPVWRGQGTVLIVDDEEAVRKVCTRILQSIGFEVIEAVDGHDGLAKFRDGNGKIVAVLLDLTMPKMDGEETFRELRDLRLGVPVVLMSGFSEDEATARFAGKGLAGFVQKPFTPDSLRQTLKAAMSAN